MTMGITIGRRRFTAFGAALLAAPAIGRAQQAGAQQAGAEEITPHQKTLYDAARAKNEQTTWYVAHYNSETAEAIGRGFDATFPGVKVNVVRTTAQVAFQRLTQDMRARVQNCDVFSSTDLGHYIRLKDEGKFEQFVPEAAAHIAKALQGLDPDGFYHTTSIGTVLINYNTARLKEAEAPRKWTDLLDPKWANRVAVGHPGFSGYVGTWTVMMRKLYGWDFFERLEKNKPQIGRSINDTVTMLNSGERLVGAGPGATTMRSAARGNPLSIIYPEDGTLLMISPSAIMKGTKNPNASRLFMEFLLGKRASAIQAENFSEIVRSDVPGPAGLKDLDQVKVIRPTPQEIEEGIPEVKELWRDTFGI